METINNELMMWLQQLGVAQGGLLVVQRVVVIMGILLIAYVLDLICRKVVTARCSWDNTSILLMQKGV